MKRLLGLTCGFFALAASIACGGDDKPAPPATNATSVPNAAASSPATPSGSPSTMPPPPSTATQGAGQPLQDLFTARAVWPVRSDDATWKQCKVMVNLAKLLAAKDPDLARAYGF